MNLQEIHKQLASRFDGPHWVWGVEGIDKKGLGSGVKGLGLERLCIEDRGCLKVHSGITFLSLASLKGPLIVLRLSPLQNPYNLQVSPHVHAI